MAKPDASRLLAARLLSVAMLSGFVFLALYCIQRVAPDVLRAIAEQRTAPYVSALTAGDGNARSVFDRDIRKNPADPSTYLSIYQACASAGRYDLAAEYLDRGLLPCKDAPRPERALLYSLLSDCYMHLEKQKPQQQAILAAQRAQDLDPEAPEYLNGYGYILADNGIQLDEAVAKISDALKRIKALPDAPETQVLASITEDSYGWALYKQGHYEAALSALSQALADLPQEAPGGPRARSEALGEMYCHLGAAYHKLQRIEPARRALQTAISNAPNSREAKEELAALDSAPPPAAGTPPTARPSALHGVKRP